MPFTAPAKPSNFELVPAGSHIGRLVRLIDLGTTINTLNGKDRRQIFMGFELPNALMKPDESNVQHPFMAGRFFTRSMSEKANLRNFIETWRGVAFANDEEAGNFPIDKTLGQPAFLNIIHKPKQNSSDMKAVITSCVKLPKEMNCPPAVNEIIMLDLDAFDQQAYDKLSDNMKAMIQQSKEWTLISGAVKPVAAPNPLAQNPNPADFDDDIPF